MAGVTADGSWTADTHCVTADGRIVCIEAELHEAALALDQLNSVAVVAVAVVEVADALDLADAAIGAQVLFGTVDETADTVDVLDAVVVPLSAVGGGGGYYPYPQQQPSPVYGVGYGVLPKLWGEAYGTVSAAGDGEGDDWPDDVLMLLLLAA